jgi:hypothetical protein
MSKPVTCLGRIYVLVLGLAAAAGWLLGLVLLPLAAWIAIEFGCSLASRWCYGAGRFVSPPRLRDDSRVNASTDVRRCAREAPEG